MRPTLGQACPDLNSNGARVAAFAAACMRRHGVAVPSPSLTGAGPNFPARGFDVRGPAFRSAEASCRGVLVAAAPKR